MNDLNLHFSILRKLDWTDIVLVLGILVGCSLLVMLTRRVVGLAAESASPQRRLTILRIAPFIRLLIWLTGIAFIIPIVIEPNFEDVAALLVTIGLTLAFALRDYASCLVAGLVTVFENTYQLGDWIEVDGIYGEVMTIGTRAVHVVTADDNKVVIPHSKLWSSSFSNAGSGKQNVLAIADFYLHPDHDGGAVRQALTEVAEASPYRKQAALVIVAAVELPWGTRYRLKTHVGESREQFEMITDLTLRGKERLRAMKIMFAQGAYTGSLPR